MWRLIAGHPPQDRSHDGECHCLTVEAARERPAKKTKVPTDEHHDPKTHHSQVSKTTNLGSGKGGPGADARPPHSNGSIEVMVSGGGGHQTRPPGYAWAWNIDTASAAQSIMVYIGIATALRGCRQQLLSSGGRFPSHQPRTLPLATPI